MVNAMPKRVLSEEDARILQALHDDYISKYGALSLHRAAEVASILITERFLAEGMKATALNEEGHDPLYVAVRFMIFGGLTFTEEYKEVFTMLVRQGADVEALKSLEDEDLDSHEGAVLANVIKVLNEVTQDDDSGGSDDTLTTEDADESTDTSSNRRSSSDSGEAIEAVANLTNYNDHQHNNSTSLHFFNDNTPQKFSFVLITTTDNLTMLKNSPERQAYEEAISIITQENDERSAKARTFIEGDSSASSMLEFPSLEKHDDSTISDPLTSTDFSTLVGASLGLFCGLVSHDYSSY
jgi:acetyl/propionyl-CoA carboxylase alpha subunit